MFCLGQINSYSAAPESTCGAPAEPSPVTTPIAPPAALPDAVPDGWQHRHLLDLERLTPEEIGILLDTAAAFKEATGGCRRRLPVLAGSTICNLFFESSTRTRTSFSLAARRLGADVVDFSAAGSSLSKGESFIDTAKNLEAMGIDAVVVRHATPGTPHLLAQHLEVGVVNAGDGPHEHPTQGLLDIFSIRERLGSLAGVTVGLVGDIAHSRTARSNLWGLVKLGAHVILCGPPTLVSRRWRELGVEVSHDLDAILPRCDVLNLLRIQFERQSTRPFPSVREYAHLYAMDSDRLRRARKNLLILAPGPINRGVEVTAEVADCSRSLILDQVTNGLAVRMAALWLTCGRRRGADRAGPSTGAESAAGNHRESPPPDDSDGPPRRRESDQRVGAG
jgi:aspartate carbamoyltransferase catalytic subunit